MGLGPTLGQVPWHEKLRRVLARSRGARLGEAAVVSRRLHVTDPQTPQLVLIQTDVDFGQVAYGRERPGEVIHIDVAHAVAEVDHRRVASAIRAALDAVPALGNPGPGRLLMDYFDLGTATGGGRVTGDLDRPQKLSMRIAHRNHVHVAGLLPDEQLPLLYLVVEAVEKEIQAQGVELRKVERLGHQRGQFTNGSGDDLSRYYGADMDSLIGGNRRREGGRATAQPGGAAAGGQSLRSADWGRHGADAGGGSAAPAGAQAGPGGPAAGAASGATSGAEAGGQPGGAGAHPGGNGPVGPLAGPEGMTGRAADPSGVHSSGAAGHPDQVGEDARADEARLQSALDLSQRLGSPDEVRRVLEELARDQGWTSLYAGGGNQAPFLMKQLEETGLIKKEVRGMRLTDSGRELLHFLQHHMKDVKLRFRKLIRRVPGSARGRSSRMPGRGAPSPDVRYGAIRGSAPAQPGAWLNDLAVPETIWAAIRRTHLERLQSGEQAGRRLRLLRTDLRVNLRAQEHALHICLLIDASASMAGRRILAAKHLARHLLVSTKDRIAVIAFQERDVRVYVPFTRDYGLVEEGLSRIQPLGLTPLAHGLTQSMELIRSSRVRRPLLLLITDGIPTVPKWTIDPLADALEAAKQVKGGRIPFGCIGLQPSRRYLEQLSREAGGTLHVVDELSEESLVTIAHQERGKLGQKAR